MDNIIIDEIEKINDSQFEAEMAVFESLITYYDKAIMILENADETRLGEYQIFNESTNIIMEGKIVNKIKTILNFMWEKFKAFFKMIGTIISKIINTIKGIFKKKTKSVDQILEDCNIKPTNSARTSAPVKTSTNNVSSAKTSKEVISIPASEKSEVIPINGVILTKDLVARFNENDTFMISYLDTLIAVDKKDNSDYLNIPYNEKVISNKVNNMGDIRAVFDLVINRNFFNRFEYVVQDVCEFFTGESTDSSKMLSSIDDFEEIMTKSKVTANTNIDINAFVRIQTKFNTLWKLVDKCSIASTDNIVSDNSHQESLQFLLNKMANFQMGFNKIGIALQEIYFIDKAYFESVNDLNKLDQFVDEMITGGMPPKYIQQNAWLVASKAIKGSSNKDKPIWGQSRVVFFPDDNTDIVHKIAMSGFGINGNKNEVFVTNKFGNAAGNFVSKITSAEKNNAVVSAIRVDTSQEPNEGETKLAAENINAYIKSKGLKFFIGDLHSKNFGRNKRNQLVVVDYGSVNPR